MLSSSQTSVRQLLFQRTQVAVLLAQGCHVARPGVILAKLLVQATHLCEERAGLLGDQAFSTLPISPSSKAISIKSVVCLVFPACCRNASNSGRSVSQRSRRLARSRSSW